MLVRMAAAFVLLGAAPAHAATCGDVITKSTTLKADLTNCPGDGLVIGADNITLDLNGHTVDGASVADTAGIRLAAHHGVTIQRGTLREFGNGVLLDGADGNALMPLSVTATVARGIQLQNGSDGNRLEYDDSSATSRTGFALLFSDGNLLAHLSASGNPFSGVQTFT